MVPVSLDCLCSVFLRQTEDEDKENKDNLEKLAPLGAQDI
jgi:hypothetical protein